MGFFGFFNYDKPGKGVEKDEYIPRSRLFFAVLGRKFFKMVPLNFLYVVFNLPLILLIVALSSVFIETEYNKYIGLFEIFALLFASVVGIGFVTPGLTSILRKFSKEDHAWIWDDFKNGIKKSFVQGLLLMIIDIVFTLMYGLAMFFYSVLAKDNQLFYVVLGLITVVYLSWFMMHFYMYQIMATFKVKLRHVIVNSFLMTFAHLPRNIIILVSILAIAYVVFIPPVVISAFLIVLFIPALIHYIITFNTVPIVDMYMLEPLEDDEK